MNRKKTFLTLAAICGGIILPGAIHVLADADDAPVTEEKVATVVSVQTGKITSATLHGYVQGFGTIEPAPATKDLPAADAQLAGPSAGIVAKVNVVEGQSVTNGEVLVQLNSVAAEQELERQKKLYAQQNTSLKNLQEAEAQLALLQVTAPLSGTVTRVGVKPGQAVDLTTIVVEVMDLNRLAVSAEIPSAEAGDLRTGEEVQISGTGFQPANAQDARSTATEVLFVSPSVNKENDTVLVRALLPKDSGLRPGQFVLVRIVTAGHTNCLAAPVESVVTDEDGKSVIALVKNGEATQMPVQTGLRENGLIEITAPEIKEGDVFVTVGAYGLPEKTKIRVQNSTGEENSSTNSADAK